MSSIKNKNDKYLIITFFLSEFDKKFIEVRMNVRCKIRLSHDYKERKKEKQTSKNQFNKVNLLNIV